MQVLLGKEDASFPLGKGRREIRERVPCAGAWFYPSALCYLPKPFAPGLPADAAALQSGMSAEGADTAAALPRSLSGSNLCKGVWCLLVSSQPWRLQNENLGFRVPKQLIAVQKSNFFLINYFNNTHNTFSCRNVSNT